VQKAIKDRMEISEEFSDDSTTTTDDSTTTDGTKKT